MPNGSGTIINRRSKTVQMGERSLAHLAGETTKVAENLVGGMRDSLKARFSGGSTIVEPRRETAP
jgi:hypothetical protein